MEVKNNRPMSKGFLHIICNVALVINHIANVCLDCLSQLSTLLVTVQNYNVLYKLHF